MSKIKVMISSTVKDLESERDAIKKAFESSDIVQLIGADPLNIAAASYSSAAFTKKMAVECDLYILVLGKRFGYVTENGKSATEIEFDEALKSDPTKILVFLKETDEEEDPKQSEFIKRVSDYNSGYWRTSFQHSHDLRDIVIRSFSVWLKERASLGISSNLIDHFIRMAKQIKPYHSSEMYYQTTKDQVRITYNILGKELTIQFERIDIYKDFWKCISRLHEQIDKSGQNTENNNMNTHLNKNITQNIIMHQSNKLDGNGRSIESFASESVMAKQTQNNTFMQILNKKHRLDWLNGAILNIPNNLNFMSGFPRDSKVMPKQGDIFHVCVRDEQSVVSRLRGEVVLSSGRKLVSEIFDDGRSGKIDFGFAEEEEFERYLKIYNMEKTVFCVTLKNIQYHSFEVSQEDLAKLNEIKYGLHILKNDVHFSLGSV